MMRPNFTAMHNTGNYLKFQFTFMKNTMNRNKCLKDFVNLLRLLRYTYPEVSIIAGIYPISIDLFYKTTGT